MDEQSGKRKQINEEWKREKDRKKGMEKNWRKSMYAVHIAWAKAVEREREQQWNY